MLTYYDIFKKVISSIPDAGACPLWEVSGLEIAGAYDYGMTYAWIHPDKASMLFLTEGELRSFGLDTKTSMRIDWIETQYRSSLLIDSDCLKAEKVTLAGRQRKLWFNRTPETLLVIDTLPLEDRLYKRYKLRNGNIYQAMEKPGGYFFTTEDRRPYAYVLPVRILLETAHDWRIRQ